MVFQPGQGGQSGGGFLPEDYVKGKAAMRSNLMGVAMCLIVTLGVVGAFFVTNRQWIDVRTYQATVNERYSTAAAEKTRAAWVRTLPHRSSPPNWNARPSSESCGRPSTECGRREPPTAAYSTWA